MDSGVQIVNMDEQINMIVLTPERYNILIDAEKTLVALEAGGVDNWEGYHDSIATYYPEKYGDEDE